MSIIKYNKDDGEIDGKSPDVFIDIEKETEFTVPTEEDAPKTIFEESLESFGSDSEEIQDSEKMKKKLSPVLIIRNTILVVCAAVVIGCGVYLIKNIHDKVKGEQLYSDLQQEFIDPTLFVGEQNGAVPKLKKMSAKRVLALGESSADSPFIDASNEDMLQEMKAKLHSLSSRNGDTYGWIYIPNSRINYPVVQGKDNDHYLNTTFDGIGSVVGAIFADFTNSKNVLENFNTVLYGHNITSGIMFHDVVQFVKDEYYFKNTLIYLYTFDGVYIYEPFAVFQAEPTFHYFHTNFANAGTFVDFLYEMQRTSLYNKGMDFDENTRILTLSTCINSFDNLRYAVQAKLVQVIR